MGDGVPGFSGDGGPAARAQLRYPSSLAVDHAGNLFIAADGRVRRVSSDGTIITVAGNGNSHPFCSTCGDGGPAVNAEVSPAAVAVDERDNLYIADVASFRIRKISPFGIISTIAGRGRPNFNCLRMAMAAGQLNNRAAAKNRTGGAQKSDVCCTGFLASTTGPAKCVSSAGPLLQRSRKGRGRKRPLVPALDPPSDIAWFFEM